MALYQQSKGYDHDFVGSIHGRFICTICTKVMKDPYLMVCCGQKYCNSCLQSWLNTKDIATCPHCRAQNRGERPFQYVIERGMKSEIESFHIKCSNNQKGCEWIGELRNLDEHLKSDQGCAFSFVACPNKCTPSRSRGRMYTRILRKDLQDHLKHYCNLRTIMCEYCNQAVTANNYASHQRKCDIFPMQCPNSCGEQGLVRQSIDGHRQTCKLEVISCEYAHVGCESTMTRQQMLKHMVSYQGKHLDMITESHRKLVQDAKEKQTIVLKELEVAKQSYGAGRNKWLLSLETQFRSSLSLSKEEIYFRMVCFREIKSNSKDWFSPPFKVKDYSMQLHVKGHNSQNKLYLELCLVNVPLLKGLKFSGCQTCTRIAIRLKKPDTAKKSLLQEFKTSTSPFPQTPDSMCLSGLPSHNFRSASYTDTVSWTSQNFGGATQHSFEDWDNGATEDTVYYDFNSPLQSAVALTSHTILKHWGTNKVSRWESDYAEFDSLLWAASLL